MLDKNHLEELIQDAIQLKETSQKKIKKVSDFIMRCTSHVKITGCEHFADIISVLRFKHRIYEEVLFTGTDAIQECKWSVGVRGAEKRLRRFVEEGWATRRRSTRGYLYKLNSEKILKALEELHASLFSEPCEKSSFTANKATVEANKGVVDKTDRYSQNKNKNNNTAAAFSSKDDPEIEENKKLADTVSQTVKMKKANARSLISKYGRERVEKQLNLWTDRLSRYEASGEAVNDCAALFSAAVKHDYAPASKTDKQKRQEALKEVRAKETRGKMLVDTLKRGMRVLFKNSGREFAFHSASPTGTCYLFDFETRQEFPFHIKRLGEPDVEIVTA